jgi:hypothetical protein
MRLSSGLLLEFFEVTLRSVENLWTTTSRDWSELWAGGRLKSVAVFVPGELGPTVSDAGNRVGTEKPAG